ncbi:sensor domain-containing diguanylate cyclase [Thermotoga profunda]|uniref:sensor domain-containing diguanylate cyclase n=1 Tax=Thermotoga profunda TaxID=1508420 RepID=UPI0009E48956|nr:sensor domain-containing diguanylate cyclase [Thermotoga profunda]
MNIIGYAIESSRGILLKKVVLLSVLSVITFCVCVWIFYSLNLERFEEKIKIARGTLRSAVDFIAKTLDNDFGQSSIYRAILNNDQIYIDKKFNEIKTRYPVIDQIYFESLDVEKLISEQYVVVFQDKIRLLFKIHDASDYLPNEAIVVLIDTKLLLELLGLVDIVVCEEGKFVLIDSIKCNPKKDFLSLSEFVISGIFSVLATVLFELVTTIRMVRVERILRNELLKKNTFQDALLEFTKLVLNGRIHDASQYILQKAVELVPGAQAGSLLMKKGDVFVFTNVYGYDQKIVGNLFFRPEELAQGQDGKVKIIKNLHKINEELLNSEKRDFLYSEGRVNQIKVLLSIPVIVKNDTIAFFNLDNFEDENAFTQESIEVAELFAGQVGLLFERIKLEEELEEQRRIMEYYSYHDPLTGLANRRLLEEFAEKIFSLARRTNRSACLLFMDLHKFKQVNDKFGHSVGDQLLKMIALRIQKSIRENDIVARLGGDEFVFLLSNFSTEEITTFTKRLLKVIQEPLVVENNVFSISANFGIAFYPTDGDNLETLLRNADMALYFSKKRSESFAFYSRLSRDQM